jgi:DNA-binding MarR family transcriptional regulator
MNEQLKLDNQVCFPIYALSREIIGLYRTELEVLDITYPQYLVLLVLWEDGTQTVNQIGEKLKLDSGTLTPLLKRLEVKGIVSRCRCSADERVVHIALTEKGVVMEQMAAGIPERVMKMSGISQESLDQLKEMLASVMGQMCAFRKKEL